MVRDWDLIRAILEAAESIGPTEQLRADAVRGDPQVVAAHMEMLHEAGYVQATVRRSSSGMFAFVIRVTYAGHDLLDTMRSDTAWSSIKKVAKARGLGLTFDVVKQIGSFVTDKLLKGEAIPGIN